MKRLTLLASVLLAISATRVQAQNENLDNDIHLVESSGKYQKAIELDRGQNFGEELRQAFLFFKQAADEGNIDAAYRVAMMYQEGRGITINYVESEKYLKFSAYSGQVDAQLLLASNHIESGEIEEAYFLAILGRALANNQSQFTQTANLLDRIKGQIDEQTIIKLQINARNCIENDFVGCAFAESTLDEDLSKNKIRIEGRLSESKNQNIDTDQTIEIIRNFDRYISGISRDEEKLETLSALASKSISTASEKFNASLGIVDDNFFSVLAIPKSRRFSNDAIAVFSLNIDGKGKAKNVVLKHSYGKNSTELANEFIPSIRSGLYPPTLDDNAKFFTYYVFFVANTDDLGSIRRVRNRLDSEQDDFAKIVRNSEKAMKEKDFDSLRKTINELERQDPFKLHQYNQLNQLKIDIRLWMLEQATLEDIEINQFSSDILKSIDDIVFLNYTFHLAIGADSKLINHSELIQPSRSELGLSERGNLSANITRPLFQGKFESNPRNDTFGNNFSRKDETRINLTTPLNANEINDLRKIKSFYTTQAPNNL